MAKNAKIEAYKVILSTTSSKKKDLYSFREFFIKKFSNKLDKTSTDNKIFNTFFQEFFKSKEVDYNEDEKRRKAFRLNKDITQNETLYTIDGVIEGGPFDVGKSTGNRKTKAISKKLGKNIIIQDDFYFLLQTKLEKNIGILILQSYGNDKIDDIFKPFISSLFELEKETYKAVISPYLPKEIEELAKETAIVSELNYQTKNIAINSLSDDKLSKLSGSFNVKIIITPTENNISLKNLSLWKKYINRSIFKLPENEMNLESFNTKTGYLKSKNIKNPVRFEIDGESISVKPTIYLEKVDEVILNENGTPDWKSLEKFCKTKLLPKLENEIYK